MNPIYLHRATRDDRTFCRDLASKFTDAIGAVSGLFLDPFIEKGWVDVAKENGQHAGMILSRPMLSHDARVCPIVAAAVPLDAQRRSIGSALLSEVEDAALARGNSILQAWCAAELPSNSFWRDMGFVPIAIRSPMGTRQRPLICWRRWILDDNPTPSLGLILPDPRSRTAGGRFARAGTRPLEDAITQRPEAIAAVLSEYRVELRPGDDLGSMIDVKA